jgi:hypothetical protein
MDILMKVNNTTVEPLFKELQKDGTVFFTSRRDYKVLLVLERNNAGLKKLKVLSEQTNDSSAFLNATCL